MLETPAEIIAKKIYYRGASIQPRDMFDIACVAKAFGADCIIEALSPFRGRCEQALQIAQRMNPGFAEAVMNDLFRREHFSEIPRQAQALTIELLATIC
jgi:hypothetical protein